MKPPVSLILILSLAIFSCGTNDQKKEPKSGTLISPADRTKDETIRTQLETQATYVETDTLTIDKKAAVFYQPDSVQMQKRITEVGDPDFRAGAGDYIYYLNISSEYLEKQGLPVFDAKNKKYLKFVLADRSLQVIRLDRLEELWGIYLFDPGKKAFAADMTIIEEEYKNYFK